MKLNQLVLLFLIGNVLVGCGVGGSPTICTDIPESEWMNQGQFQDKLVSEGYTIQEFKVTEGKCYEIYGRDKDDNKVEIYFNPVDGSIVKQEIH